MWEAGLYVDPYLVLDEDQSTRFKKIFVEIDTKSRDVGIDELRAALTNNMQSIGMMTQEELDAIIASAACDHNGRVNFDELLVNMANRESTETWERLDPRKVARFEQLFKEFSTGDADCFCVGPLFKEIDNDQSHDTSIDELPFLSWSIEPRQQTTHDIFPSIISLIPKSTLVFQRNWKSSSGRYHRCYGVYD